ncbi:MAG: hypothetical protein Q4C70_08595 [Planctomycetia bacterium]|nr:hypothetical protein [Planctomycetia bacterium]
MSFYKDTENRTWYIALNVGVFREIREKIEYKGRPFDLLNVSDPTTLQAVATDAVLLVDLLALITSEQRKTAGVSVSDFMLAHKQDTLITAQTALLEALADFFPTMERLAIQDMMRTLAKSREEATRQLERKAETQETPTAYGV